MNCSVSQKQHLIQREVQKLIHYQLINQKLNTIHKEAHKSVQSHKDVRQQHYPKPQPKPIGAKPLQVLKPNAIQREMQRLLHNPMQKPLPNPKPQPIQRVAVQKSNPTNRLSGELATSKDSNESVEPVQGVKSDVSGVWTCEELQRTFPEVQKLREIFNLFARLGGCNTINVLKVPECLHAMGLHFVESTLKNCLTERLLKFPQSKPPNRVSFEFVLTVYCDVASLEDVPTATVMINGLRYCDSQNTGFLPYTMLRRMLTSVGERLNDAEVSALLDNMKDENGNVQYVALLEAMFSSNLDAVEKLKQSRLYLQALGKNASHMDMHKRDEFIRSLRNLDTTQTGFVAPDRLLELLNANGDRFTVTELSSLTRGMINCKKHVDYRMFLRLIMND